MTLAVLGAFPFPHVQGSQVYARDQVRALHDAGARPTLICYGRGQATGPGASGEAGLPAGVEILRTPSWLGPGSLRAGPQLGKPLADLALAWCLVRAHRERRFRAVLAHNAEAALAALAARAWTRIPVVYVAHTLLAHELSAYGPAPWRSRLDGIGGRIDRVVARSADGILALSQEAADELAPWCPGPTAVVPPGLAPAPLPDARARVGVCERHALEPGRFVLYTGNLDAYQELDLLAEAAHALAPTPVVVATHDADALARPVPGLCAVVVRDWQEVRALCAAAGALVATRRRPGGFPIKLLQYMESGRPIAAFAGAAPGLRDGVEAVLLPSDAGARELADAVRGLLDDPARSLALGRAARARLSSHHDPAALAERTLALVEKARRARAARAFDTRFDLSVEIDAPVARVFSELGAPEPFLGLQPDLEEMTEVPAGTAEPPRPATEVRRFRGWKRLELPGGGRARGRVDVGLRPSPEDARVEALVHGPLGLVTRSDFRLEIAPGGTRVEETVALRSPRGLRALAARRAQRSQARVLERLKQRLESESDAGTPPPRGPGSATSAGPPGLAGAHQGLATRNPEEGPPDAGGRDDGLARDHAVHPVRVGKAAGDQSLGGRDREGRRDRGRGHAPQQDAARDQRVREPVADAPAKQPVVAERLERRPPEAQAGRSEAHPVEQPRRAVRLRLGREQIVHEAGAEHHRQAVHERERNEARRAEDPPGGDAGRPASQCEGEAADREDRDARPLRDDARDLGQRGQRVAEPAQHEGQPHQQLGALAVARRQQQQARAHEEHGQDQDAAADDREKARGVHSGALPRGRRRAAQRRTSRLLGGKNADQMLKAATAESTVVA